ncbi:plastocyanin/azurin family copper-binding protein [Rhodobacteraceae bacterium LMO-12]|nr:plastocyanin/azurin family copper-binding protein [Rhodobacteraceae bacterium LMO-JJ12]
MNIKSTLIGLALTVASVLPAGAESYEIDQLIDLTALTPEDVYRFSPSYLWIEPGDSIKFLNSTGNHTVTAIEGMWPDGAALVNIEHKPEAEVTFEKPGIYGFRCKVHGRHGMYALIVVGSPEPNIDSLDMTGIGGLGQRIFAELLQKMNEDANSKGQ